MDEKEKEEEKEEEKEDAEQETDEEETDASTDETIGQLLDTIERQDAEIERLTTELTELRGRYDEHHTRHHSEPERQELPEPEPIPEERHAWFRPIRKR